MIFDQQSEMDILVWRGGIVCYRYELDGMRFQGDDYRVIEPDSREYAGYAAVMDY